MKRIFSWSEMDADLKSKAVLRLAFLAEKKVLYDGTVVPYAWPERVAPLLEYYVVRGRSVWDFRVPKRLKRQGILSVFDVPILSIDALREVEA